MIIPPHRDGGPDGVTVITGTGTGYAAFTDAEDPPVDLPQVRQVPA
jgi:hypothetical protein